MALAKKEYCITGIPEGCTQELLGLLEGIMPGLTWYSGRSVSIPVLDVSHRHICTLFIIQQDAQERPYALSYSTDREYRNPTFVPYTYTEIMEALRGYNNE